MSVICLQYSDGQLEQGSDTWKYVPELVRQEPEPLVSKSFSDVFEGTGLEELLTEARIARLFVTGAQVDECIRATRHGALNRGYDVTLVGDAHRTEDQSAWGAPLPFEA